MTNDKITLAKDTIANDDVDRLIEWLKTYPRLTKGPVTLKFEEEFSKYIGTKYSIFVNSGSSAILLAIYALIEMGKLQRGDSVLLPALSWATDFAPLIQFGLQPILVDANPDDLSIDIQHARKLIAEYHPKALILVSVLGLVPDMDEIVKMCEESDVILLEDACESLGSEFRGKKLGSFGFASMFSTYFGHHISTLEGGVICTDNFEFAEMALSLRSHGWSRDMSSQTKKLLKTQNNISDFEELYTFYYCGFNLRPTDLQAYVGLSQLEKLPKYIENRERNFKFLMNNVSDKFWKPAVFDDRFYSNFAYPMISDQREKTVKALLDENVEVRPLIAGSIGRQPFYINADIKNKVETPFANMIHDNGLYLPNHALLTERDLNRICKAVNSTI
jgi:CDP-6-deoxy-D-xylo-4-hexulose-3-dehydrase